MFRRKPSLLKMFNSTAGGHSRDVNIYATTTEGTELEIFKLLSLSKHRYFLACSLSGNVRVQVVTVGVVGGSDLIKISEQLGNSGLL